MSPKHVVSCSFGKDSIATILLALEHGEPLDEAVYCEVMFDDTTSGEVPEHQAFIYQAAIPALEKTGRTCPCASKRENLYLCFYGKGHTRAEERYDPLLSCVREMLCPT